MAAAGTMGAWYHVAMDLRPFWLVSAIALAVQVGLALFGLAQVPPGTEVPIHWGISGEPDGYASPAIAFLFTPLVTAGMIGLFAIIPRVEPRRTNLEGSSAAYLAVAVTLILFFTGLQLVIVLSGVGSVGIPMNVVVGLGAGVMFIVIGASLRSVRSNFLFGVRTPWTLTSERSWIATHRLVGRLFVVLGLALVAASLIAPPEAIFWVIIGGVMAILVASFGYSYVVWRDDPDREGAHPRGPSPS
jgi:uncharacterized membrane protein